MDLGAFAHAEVPFERLVDEVAPARSAAHAPLFQVALELRNLESVRLALPGLTVSAAGIEVGVAKFDLQLSVAERFGPDGVPAGLSAEFTFATDLFEAATVRSFAQRLVRIVTAVVADPGVPVGDIEILDRAERAVLVPVRGRPGGSVRCLPEIFAAAAARDPDAAALRCGGVEMTYRELEEESNRLARVLIEHGAGPEGFVAVAVARSVASVLAVWAVAKTGAGFVPVDPDYPGERIGHMLTDCGAVVGVTVTAHRGALPDTVAWLDLHDPAVVAAVAARSGAPVTDTDRRAPLRLDHVAYLIYTSGSTGTPKGVAVTHRGLHNFAAESGRRCAAAPPARACCISPHRASTRRCCELSAGVRVGATMVIAPPGVRAAPSWRGCWRTEQITHAFVTPAALATVDPDGSRRVRCVCGRWRGVSAGAGGAVGAGAALFNAYGPPRRR